MASEALCRLTRRAFVLGALFGSAGPALAQPRPVVTILGDSITAGLGLPRAQALPARLQAALAASGVQALVRGAGVSGDTTADGLARLDFSVQKDTAVCVVALGGNDLLQGMSPAATEANLKKIVSRLRARKIRVVLAGLRVPTAVGRGYAREMEAAFAAAGKAPGVAFVPDLLAGVAGVKALNQADGIHPNAKGVEILARTLAPAVRRALGAR
jgi:acyl-CoA thioesterase-1